MTASFLNVAINFDFMKSDKLLICTIFISF